MNTEQINKNVQESLSKLSALVITSLFLLIATEIDLLLGPILIILAIGILIILGFALWISSEWALRKITTEEKDSLDEKNNTKRPTSIIEENMFLTNFNLFIVILFQDRDVIEHFLGPYAAVLSTIIAGVAIIYISLLLLTEAFKKQTNKEKIRSQKKEILNLIFNMAFSIPSSMLLIFLTRSKSVLIVFLASNPLTLLIISTLLVISIVITHYLDKNYNKFSNNKTEQKTNLKQHIMGHIKNFSIKFSKDMQKNLIAIMVVTICVITLPQPSIILIIFIVAVTILIVTQISSIIHELTKDTELKEDQTPKNNASIPSSNNLNHIADDVNNQYTDKVTGRDEATNEVIDRATAETVEEVIDRATAETEDEVRYADEDEATEPKGIKHTVNMNQLP